MRRLQTKHQYYPLHKWKGNVTAAEKLDTSLPNADIQKI